MPEGDTIWRTANRLRRALKGRRIEALATVPAALPRERIEGHRVADVEARGKALLVHLETEDAIFSHMGMTGSWHLYRRGEAWRKPARAARLVLSVAAGDAVLFTPDRLEFVPAGALAGHPFLRRLGPDVLAPDFDVAEARERLRRRATTTIAEALLDQSAISGIGNIFKSESLFVAEIDPRRTVGSCGTDELERVVSTARSLMLPCVADETRTLRAARAGADRYWVYLRRGRPCFRCAAIVARVRQGHGARSTYFCAGCQS